jgi:hypothetical protein
VRDQPQPNAPAEVGPRRFLKHAPRRLIAPAYFTLAASPLSIAAAVFPEFALSAVSGV